jgi:hypothetical protein
LALVLPVCGGDDDVVGLKLDGTPRYPDDEGVLVAVTDERITLGPGRRRTYRLSSGLQSFSTYTRQLEPVRHRRGQYVQVGLDDNTAVWVSGVAAVLPGPPTVVYYTGYLVRIDTRHRAVFQDGTVLRLASDADVPVRRGFVQAEIDPERGQVRRLVVP